MFFQVIFIEVKLLFVMCSFALLLKFVKNVCEFFVRISFERIIAEEV